MKDKKETIYVVDTNVIISDPDFIKKINGKILIPKTVLEELDKNKQGRDQKARNIREFARFVDSNSDTFWFHNSDGYEGTNDDKIIKTAISIRAKGYDVILVTNDILMGLIAKTSGLKVKRHTQRPSTYKIYPGIEDCRDDKRQSLPRYPNKFVLKNNGLYCIKGNVLSRLNKDRTIWGISHKNLEQKCAIEAAMNPDIQLLTITGVAGTGKTLISIAAGLEQVVNSKQYERIIVARPIVPMGKELGYLPGELDEKLSPWMQPIFDNLEYLNKGKGWTKYMGSGILQLEALSYIRGRSIPNQLIIIDEAQNLTKHEVKTIISRAGEGTKIILTGDVDQIDHPKLDATNNGLTHVIEKFKEYEIAAHIHLTQCERSELAELAAEIL